MFLAMVSVARAEVATDGACSQDIQTHCSSVVPGESSISGCLHKHHDHLSEGCKHSIEVQRQIRHDKKEMRKKKRRASRDVKNKATNAVYEPPPMGTVSPDQK